MAGVTRWSAWHDHWGKDVAACALDTPDGRVFIYWLPEQQALVAGDVLLGSPLRLCPKSWLGKATQDDLRAA